MHHGGSLMIGRAFGRYALLNLCACALFLAGAPYVVREAYTLAVVVSEDLVSDDATERLPNLVEKRLETKARKAPSPEALARLPASALPSVPLTDRTKLAVVELVATTNTDAIPLVGALDAAESIPVKPLRPLHKSKFTALYADLTRREARRKALALAAAERPARVTTAQRTERRRARELAAIAAERDLNAGTIGMRNMTNSLAYLTP